MTRTRDGFAPEMFYVPLTHQIVARIYNRVMGGLPATGLELDDVLDNWDTLEPRLRAEIETLLPPEGQPP